MSIPLLIIFLIKKKRGINGDGVSGFFASKKRPLTPSPLVPPTTKKIDHFRDSFFSSRYRLGVHPRHDIIFSIFYVVSNLILFQFFTCQHLICLKIFIDCFIHDILRKCPVIIRICFQPVAGKLFVKGWLSMSRFVSFSWPETRTVWCQHLITDYKITIFIQTKLKFCVCNDNSFAQCVLCTFFYIMRLYSHAIFLRILFPVLGNIFPDVLYSAHRKCFRHGHQSLLL